MSKCELDIWQEERGALTKGIKNYRLDLDGFIHALSGLGAINY